MGIDALTRRVAVDEALVRCSWTMQCPSSTITAGRERFAFSHHLQPHTHTLGNCVQGDLCRREKEQQIEKQKT